MGFNGAGLIERPISFGYDFRMCCTGCGQASALSGSDYVRLEEQAGSKMDCAHCGDSFTFGPLTSGIRDQNDPALDDSMINRFSWYHTSTYARLSGGEFAREMRAVYSRGQARGLIDDAEAMLQTRLDKALHLGTYESAIENMYRRMRDENDHASVFYLHRMRIDVAAGRVNPGYRDETRHPAAHVGVTEMAGLGLDAIRYLNVWESSGSISLAVSPHVITATQTIPIPLTPDTGDGVLAALLEAIADLAGQDHKPADSEEQRLHRFGAAYELESALVSSFLTGVNAKVARDVARAVADAHCGGDGDPFGHARLFAQHAAMLSDSQRVLARLDATTST